MEVTGDCLPHVVHFSQLWCFSRDYWLRKCLLFVVYFILNILQIIHIYHVEAVIVVACQQSVWVLWCCNAKLIKNRIILEDLTKFRFQRILNVNTSHWLICLTNIPNLYSQEISAGYVLSIVQEGYGRITWNHLSEKVFFFLGLKLKIYGLIGIWINGKILEIRMSEKNREPLLVP